MKTALLLTVILMGSTLAFAHNDPTISTAKIAELSAHRADRLVALGKINAAFVQKIEHIEVTKLSSGAAAYKSIITQTQPQTGTALQLELQFDHDGKPLSFKVLAGGSAGPDMGWSPKSAGELIENGMHYIIDNSTDATVAPYFNDFTNLILIRSKLGGKDVALLQVTASSQAQPLNIYLNLDGTINSVGTELGWSSKSAGELAKNGMHYIIANSSDTTFGPYFNDFTNLVLMKSTLGGKDVALLQVTASSQAKPLNIYLNLDGTINSVVVEP